MSEQDTATSRHVAVINEEFARKFLRNEDPLGKHFGRDGMGSGQHGIVGIAKDARYLPENLGKPIAPLFFLPEAQHDFAPKAGATEVSPGSHFLKEIVIVTSPGASLSIAQVRQATASVDPDLPLIWIRSLRASGRSVQATTADCTAHFVLRSPFACLSFHRAIWSYCL